MLRLCGLYAIIYFVFMPLSENSVLRVADDDNTTDRCNDLLEEFASQSSKFSLCAVLHARPIRICQRCVNQFKNVTDIYSSILKSNNSKGEECKKALLSADRLGVLQQVNLNVQDLWSRGNCQSCYDVNATSGEYHLSNNTVKFIELHSAAKACIDNHTRPADPSNSTVCIDCEKDYCDLNTFYNNLKAVQEDEVCMDIIDSMNQTRILWSDNLKCVRRSNNVDVLLFVTSAVVSSLPLLFYLGAKLFSIQTRNPLQTQKRLSENFAASNSRDDAAASNSRDDAAASASGDAT